LVDDKDRSDVFRIMQVTAPASVVGTFRELLGHQIAGPPTVEALDHLDQLFGRHGRPGLELTARALRTAISEARVEAICVVFTGGLREALGQVPRPPTPTSAHREISPSR
jgi:hypothetical protein